MPLNYLPGKFPALLNLLAGKFPAPLNYLSKKFPAPLNYQSGKFSAPGAFPVQLSLSIIHAFPCLEQKNLSARKRRDLA